MILAVNDRDTSVDFYTNVLGLVDEGQDGPFTVLRVTPEFTIQLAPWGTGGGEHLAFAMTRSEFDSCFGRVRAAGIEFGDSFDSVGNMQGPGDEAGARGSGKAVYFFDPSKHLIEIRHYRLLSPAAERALSD
jgi:catechol 2,3-dioxygenase-like lactoylglutathione lyase family enzyme